MRILFFLFWITLSVNACHKEQTLFVADHFGTSENIDTFLLIRQSNDEDWKPLYCSIEGFDYQEGSFYEVKVKVYKDQKNRTCPLKYKLVKVISKNSSEISVQEPSENIFGNWIVTQLQDIEIKPEAVPFFSISKNAINGHNGCNTFGGKVIIQDSSHVKFHQLISTKMFCVETANLEFDMMNAITKTDSYKLENGVLYLTDKEGNVLLKAVPKTNDEIRQAENQTQDLPFLIKYAKSSRGHISQFEYDGKTISVEQTRPETFKKTIAVSQKDQATIKALMDKIDWTKLGALTPPSTKHQFDGALVVNLDIMIGDKMYSVPAFDDGNPNESIKTLVEKLKTLAESK